MSLFVIAFPMTMISIKYSQVVSKYIQQKRILRNKLKEAAARDPDHQKINGGDFMKQYRKLDEDEDDEDLDETTEDEFSAVYHSAKSGGSSSLFDDGHGTEHHHRHQSQQHKKTPSESKGFPSSAIIQISGMDGSDIGDNNVATMTVKVRSREHYMKLLTMLASSA